MISLAPRAGPSFRLLLYIKLLLVHMSRLCTIYYIQWFRRRWRLVIGVVSVCWTVCFDDLAKEGQERCSYFSQKSCRIRGECRTWYLGRWTWRGHGHSGWNGSSSSLNAIRQPQKSHNRNGRSQRYVLQNAHHPRRTPRPRKQRFARPGLPKSLPLAATPSPR